MDRAWIDGKAVALKAAIAEAAKLLGASRFPLIAGLGADVAGTRAAIALAERLGAAIDHMHSDVLLRRLDSMREAEVMITTAADVRARRLFVAGRTERGSSLRGSAACVVRTYWAGSRRTIAPCRLDLPRSPRAQRIRRRG